MIIVGVAHSHDLPVDALPHLLLSTNRSLKLADLHACATLLGWDELELGLDSGLELLEVLLNLRIELALSLKEELLWLWFLVVLVVFAVGCRLVVEG